MKATSAMSWEEAAPILYEAMDNIMEGELDVDDDEEGVTKTEKQWASIRHSFNRCNRK